MISLGLVDLKLYQTLLDHSRHEKAATVLAGALVAMEGDAGEFLEYIRSSLPSYTAHNLQHSWRVLDRIGAIVRDDAIKCLTSTELFSLIAAAAFHDIGNWDWDGADVQHAREQQHCRASDFIQEYMAHRLTIISEYRPRLAKCVGFIAESHGLTWQEMTSRQNFKTTETVFGQTLRAGVLCILLRVGDLLDIDADRSCDALRRVTRVRYPNIVSDKHHEWHKHVEHMEYNSERISITVRAESRDEHLHWNEWFGFLTQDILHANTYVFSGSLAALQLPQPDLEVRRAPEASYELWPLKFEIDEKGRIWEVMSQAIYTGRFDFVREVIQNSIDACLIWIYLSVDAGRLTVSPRNWSLDGYNPGIILRYSSRDRVLEVRDNGIGMDRHALEQFLFKVAETGFDKIATAKERFPSIAKFGLGFISVLLRATDVLIESRSREPGISGGTEDVGRRVSLKTEAQDAFAEVVQCSEGTRIVLRLKEDYSESELMGYVRDTFAYPSVPILCVALGGLSELIDAATSRDLPVPEGVPRLLEIGPSGDETAQDIKEICGDIEAVYSSVTKTLKRRRDTLSMPDIDSVRLHIDRRAITRNTSMSPFVLVMDDEFRVSSFGRRLDRAIGRTKCAVIWLPVSIVSYSDGIEWESIHGFILSEGHTVRSLTRFYEIDPALGYGDSTIIVAGSELGDTEKFAETIADFLPDAYEELTRRQSEGFDSEAGEGSDWFDKRAYVESLLLQENRIVIASASAKGGDAYVVEDLRDDLLSRLPGYERSVRVARAKSKADKIVDEMIAINDELNQGLQSLDNRVFQDGMRIPVEAWWLAPVGACRARVNLTGPARLDLNITRHSINESPTLLSQWASEVAPKIYSHVIDSVIGPLREVGCEIAVSEIIAEPSTAKGTGIFPFVRDGMKRTFPSAGIKGCSDAVQ